MRGEWDEGQQWRQGDSAPEEQEGNKQLGEQEGLGRAKRSQGRRTEVWGALEQERWGGSCALEAWSKGSARPAASHGPLATALLWQGREGALIPQPPLLPVSKELGSTPGESAPSICYPLLDQIGYPL